MKSIERWRAFKRWTAHSRDGVYIMYHSRDQAHPRDQAHLKDQVRISNIECASEKWNAYPRAEWHTVRCSAVQTPQPHCAIIQKS